MVHETKIVNTFKNDRNMWKQKCVDSSSKTGKVKDMKHMLNSNETTDQLAKGINLLFHRYMVMKEDGHVSKKLEMQ